MGEWREPNTDVVRVLVVDDEPIDLALLRAQLGAAYAVELADSGAAALAAVAAAPPDLILLDVMMPGMDGYAVCRRLKADTNTRNIPVVLLTALRDSESLVAGLDAGADEFLVKPVRHEELLARVRSLLRHARLQKQLRATLAVMEAERATLTAVMHSMTEGLVVVNADGRVQYCNVAAAALSGVPAAAIVGQPADAAFARVAAATEDPVAALRARARALGDLEPRPSFLLSFVGPPPCDVRVQLFPVRRNDATALGYGVLFLDLTRERALARAKDELVSMVSHELRTPLSSLVGFAELMLTRAFSEEERREFLRIIHEEGQRLTAIINDFLDIRRLESGRQHYRLVPTHLHELLARAVAVAGEDAQRPIRLQVPADLPLMQADRDRMLQVLANLLSNARKYSPHGGEIWLRARAVGAGDGSASTSDGAGGSGLEHPAPNAQRPASNAALQSVEIAVTDQGLGLPPEALPRLFETFYRVDSSDTRNIRGTGLGLAICKQIVEAHGGRIWAVSDGVGRGSTFAFTLPAARAASARAHDPPRLEVVAEA